VAAARLLAEPPDPRRKRLDLPDAFARLILKCMARSRDDRFANAELVASELASLTQPAVQIGAARPALREEAPAAEPAPSGSADKVVAVLPFRNQGSADDEYLADELTDDLIDTLSMTRGLKVRPRAMTARWKGADEDPREIGRELGAQVVVGGSVRRRAGAVRISARLISVSDGFQLWARHLTRPEAEVLRLNDEVAQAIVEALTLDVASAPVRDIAMNPAALDLFLRGRHEYRRFWSPGVRRAIELYEQALAFAPGDPMILSAYALARCRLWFFTAEGGDDAIKAAEQAVAAAPDLGEARLAMATVRFQQGDTVAAVRELKRAVAQTPSLAEAQTMLGSILLEAGVIEDGRRRLETALSLDPSAPQTYAPLVRLYAFLGMQDEVDALVQKAAQYNADIGAVRMRLAFWRRQPEEALEIEKTLPLRQGGLPVMRGMLYILKHREYPPDPPDFITGVTGPGTTARRRSFVRQVQAEVEGFLGRNEEVVTALRLSADDGLVDLMWLERCPLLDAVRGSPGYAAVHAVVKRRAEEILAVYRAG
jgi:serine/threonine-protein kinase